MSRRARTTPERLNPRASRRIELVGARVLGLVLVVFVGVAGSLPGPRRHLAGSEGDRGAGDGSKRLRGSGQRDKPRRVSGNRRPDVESPPPPDMPPQIPVQ